MGVTVATREIPFFNYKTAFTSRIDDYLRVIENVIRRGAFIQQRDLYVFEEHLAAYLGVRHAIGVGNATDGLIMIYKALGIGPESEVIFPSHTMVASPASVAHCGATPVPVECGADHLIDADSVEAAITPRTRVLMPVHLNGRTCDMDSLKDIAARHDLLIVEDAAQALGSSFKGRFAGTFGVAAAFSFYPAKILGCFGDGGAVVTNDDEIARKIRLLRDHGRNEQGEVEVWGLNSRLDNLQAAILDLQLADYANIISHRRALASEYHRGLNRLPNVLLPPGPDEESDHFDVFQNYEIEADRRDQLRAYLSTAGIGTIIQWGGKAVHQFTSLGFSATLPKTEAVFERCLMLPMNTTLGPADAQYVASKIHEFYSA